MSGRLNRSLIALVPVLLLLAAAIALSASFPGEAQAAASCVSDDEGPNDEPGQKDLTEMCFEAPVAGQQSVSWNWDELGTNGNNTLDACALFDTDGDSKANFAVCHSTIGNPAQDLDTVTYTCNDTRSDRCAGKQISTPNDSLCTVSEGTDPFVPGGSDTTADCTVQLADVGTSDSVMLNVCSYPSGEPNSDPSDCVLIPDLPRLSLVKTVTNDNGGSTLATSFTLTATGPTTVTGATGSASVTSVGVPVGSYALSESSLAGYTAGSWSCSGSGTFTAPNTIALSFGQNATCTINNDDDAPALHLRKTITNNNGGTASAADWTLTASGQNQVVPTDLSGSTPVDSGATFKADTYLLGETGGSSGYTAGTWSCVVTGTSTVVPVSNSRVVVGLGADVTCTINNDDDAPALHLRKTITNNNGGTASAADWTLTASGQNQVVPTDLSGSTPVDSGATFKADTYLLGETGGSSGYTAGTWSCVVTGTSMVVPVSGDQVVVGLGTNVTCTVNNDDDAPALRLRKTITSNNGGTASAADWTLTATGQNQAIKTNLSGPTPVDSGGAFKPDTYVLGETGPGGYTAGDWSCVVTGTGTVVPVSNSQVVVGPGADVTCTVNNDDDKASPSGATVQTWILHDTLTISGIRTGAVDAATATVTFSLYSDASCSVQVGNDETASIAGGIASTSTGVAVTRSGYYYWRAEYSGDQHNNGFTTGCGDEVTLIQAKDAFGSGRDDFAP